TWIKQNLYFFIAGVICVALLGGAAFYDYKGWSHNSAAFDKLNEIYGKLQSLNHQKPAPGNKKVDNTKAAAEQEQQIRKWIAQTGKFFQPIAPIPSGNVTSEQYAAELRRTIDQLQHEAESASVLLMPQYSFSFTEQLTLMRFAPGSLQPLAAQLGEVKTISEILFAARVNQLDGIQRTRVSDDDTAGPQSDYIDDQSVTNEMAVLTPYIVTFRSFTPELASVLADFASSPHGFVVTAINVQPASAVSENGGTSPETNPQMPSPYQQTYRQPYQQTYQLPARGGLPTVLNEQLLRVTLELEIVKPLLKM
ncbi:MAG: hypothetical protein ACREFE_15375, partial [Limisphaerales bacterium]